MSGAGANCSPTSSLPRLGLNQADQGLRANGRSLILSRRGGPGFVSERGSCAPSPDSGVLPHPRRSPPRRLRKPHRQTQCKLQRFTATKLTCNVEPSTEKLLKAAMQQLHMRDPVIKAPGWDIESDPVSTL